MMLRGNGYNSTESAVDGGWRDGQTDRQNSSRFK
jgi:hypothetical protein